MATFYDLPEDAVREIIINLDYKSVLAHCSSDKLAEKICRKQGFWRTYINSLPHAEYQEFLLYLARERYDLYPFLRRLIKYNFRIIDMLTLYFIWIYVLEAQQTTDEDMSDFVSYLRNLGELRQKNLKYDEGWRYVFNNDTVKRLKMVWNIPYMIKNDLFIEDMPLYIDIDMNLYLDIIPYIYIGEYLSKNLTVKEMATYLNNSNKKFLNNIGKNIRNNILTYPYLSDIIQDSLGEYWGETNQLYKIKNFHHLIGYIMDSAYIFASTDLYKLLIQTDNHFQSSNTRILNPDRIIHLLKKEKCLQRMH